MKIINQGEININKRTIYLDVDDVVLKSSECIIQMLKNKYQIKKSIEDLKDWQYKSIYKYFEINELIEFFKSEYFWQNVEYNKELIKGFEEINLLEKYNLIFVTKGSEENLIKKYNYIYNIKYFKENKNKIGFIGIDLDEPKSKVKMLKGIQIDDSIDNLINTDATLKILLTNNLQTEYNLLDKWPKNIDNFYVVNMVEDLIKILQYNLEDTNNLVELDQILEKIDY